MPASTYDHFYGQNYTNQPTRQDPWTGEAPLRNSNVLPHSGMAMFDPISDPTSTFPSLGVDDWMNNNGNYVISPTGPPANATFFHGTQPNIPRNTQPQFYNNMHNQALNTSPVDLIPTLPSPSPDSQNFINYNQQHSFFKEHYNANLQTNPVPSVTSSMGKQIHFQYQGPSSPQASAPSPSSSDGIFSSYNSDSGMMLDRFPNEHFDAKLPSPQSPMQSEYSSTVAGPDGAFNASPEPEHSRQATGKGSGRPGGRALGTHLDPNVAKAAHDMRKIVACWHCVLQRDKCGPGDVCDRCVKRSQRPNADCGLGCSRIKLIELSQSFLPTLVTQMHEDAHLTHFVSQHIHQWGNTEISLYITCGARMPRMQVKVYEFLPKGTELLYQIQYKTNPATRARYQVRKNSPALGMVHINHNEEKKYDKYINDIVDNHIDAFGRLCWMEDDNDFQQKLFKLLTRVKPKNDNEAKLLHEVFRLIVVTFIMSHTLTIAEDTKLQSLSMMHSFAGADAYTTNFTSPRMTNRQLKYFFSRLHRQILTAVLNTLQQIFKSSKGCDKWLAAFVAVVGMCMAHEDQQKTIHLVMQTRSTTEGFDARDAQARADIACREIDARMGFIGMIFRWKYNRKCNPLREPELDWEKEAGFGDESSVMFVRQVAQLVKENTDFLQLRQNVSISPANQTRYTSRLVSHFLLSFWLPS
ncbi:hypothetical protein BDV95DRAFT_219797 [Massariosphaeria phaeospora]|uniref:Uncharacterized protein n=1 Tax=Massariosphaeria phaeospora TaxID=100035 RepID=A0A7C8MGD5_9PLEO|nr:hypothetical protein BDV95DRAFT_219797 [Massariosphaeria phaeospora]